MAGNDEDRGISRIPSAEDRGCSSIGLVLGDQMIERSGDIVCGLYCVQGDGERGVLGSASKPRSTVCQWFGLETTRSGFLVWTSKSVATVW
jgi:hypothetical protein